MANPVKKFIFPIKRVNSTWTISLRRAPGKLLKVMALNQAGKKLKCKSKVIGDRLVVMLKDGPSTGQIHASFVLGKNKYFNIMSRWSKIKNAILGFVLRLLRRG